MKKVRRPEKYMAGLPFVATAAARPLLNVLRVQESRSLRLAGNGHIVFILRYRQRTEALYGGM